MEDTGSLAARTRWLSLLAGLTFALFTVRAALLVVAGQGRAHGPTVTPRPPPQRGRILAATGEVLADNEFVYELDVSPATLLEHPRAIDRLAAMLGFNEVMVLTEGIMSAARGNTASLRLRGYGDPLASQRVRAECAGMPGVSVVEAPRRRYPQGGLTSFPVGFMSDVDASEVGDTLGYRRGDRIGRAGIERSWELTLRGVSSHAPERQGMTLSTFLDLRLQRVAADALGDHGGSVIALDPQDGRVLAYVSSPGFEPESFERYVPFADGPANGSPSGEVRDHASWTSVVDDLLHPLIAVAALQHGYALPTTHRCAAWTPQAGSGPRTPSSFERSLAAGCASYFDALVGVHAVPRSTVEETLQNLGFGRLTGVDLREEYLGDARLPTQCLQSRGGCMAIVATPLQIAVAYAALANGGTIYQPRLVDRILRPGGEHASRTTPVVSGRIALPDGARERVLAALRDVVSEGRTLRYNTPVLRDIGALPGSGLWFVGLAPAAAPRVVVVVTHVPNFIHHVGAPDDPLGRDPDSIEGDHAADIGLAVLRTWQQLQPAAEGRPL